MNSQYPPRRLPPSPAPAPACTADQCQQGRAACPCPQACELPGTEADPLHDDPATTFELVTMWLVIAALACGAVLAIKACASA